MTSFKKNYTINKIYFAIDDKDQFLEDNDEYLNTLSCVYKTSTFIYEDVLYYNIQLDFTQGRLPQEDFNNIIENFNKCNQGGVVSKAFYKFQKNKEDLKLTYKNTV